MPAVLIQNKYSSLKKSDRSKYITHIISYILFQSCTETDKVENVSFHFHFWMAKIDLSISVQRDTNNA